MNQNGIMFSLVAVPDEIAGGKKVYRAYVKTNGTIDKEALAKALAEKTGQDISLANYFLDALNEILAREIVAGYRASTDGLDAVRLYPCVKTDMKTMFVAADTMNPFRGTSAEASAPGKNGEC